MAGAVDHMMRGMLQKTDAEKAFMPWWQDVEDKLLYSLMILGAVRLVKESLNMYALNQAYFLCTFLSTSIYESRQIFSFWIFSEFFRD